MIDANPIELPTSPMVRAARDGDEFKIQEILITAYQGYKEKFQPTALTLSIRDLLASLDQWLVITIKAQIVGCVLSERKEDFWTFCFLSVHPLFRGQGLGQLLLNQAIRQAIRSECPVIRVILRRTLTENKRYFERNGFVYDSPFSTGYHDVYILKLEKN